MTDRERQKEVVSAVRAYDLNDLTGRKELDDLSTHTTVEAVEVDPFAIVLDGNKFEGAANLYVTLEYEPEGQENFREADSFLGSFHGHFDNGQAVIDSFDVDTSPRRENEIFTEKFR